MSRVVLPGAFLLLSWVGGCDRSGEEAAVPGQSDRSRTGGPARAVTEIDRLRSLPYAGYAPGASDEHEDGVMTYDPQRSCPGYNLYIMHKRSAAELLDAEGCVLRRWQYEPSHHWGNGELLPNGDFVVVGSDPSDLPDDAVADDKRYVLRFDWDGKLLWKRQMTAHHDIEVTPRDQLLTLTCERRDVPPVDPILPVRDEYLTLLSHDGEVLERVSLCDVVRKHPRRFPIWRIRPTEVGGTPWIDLFHCNSVEWMHHEHLADRNPLYESDNVLVCSRHQDRILIVNWDEKEVVWAWGKEELHGPHDARLLENGNILVFDNGVGRGWSRVIELDPVREEIVWEYRAPDPTDFYTLSQGSSQRLPNGNTLITNSDSGIAFEVTRDGRIVWEFRCPHKNEAGQRATIVRTKRYERAFVEAIQARYASPAAHPEP